MLLIGQQYLGKMVTYELSNEEKLLLKQQKVSQKMLRDYATDEIAAMLNASPERTKELAALTGS